MKELDGVIEIECQMIQIKQGTDVDIGANASAQEADEELEDGVVIVNNVVSAFRLQDTTFDKKQYTLYLKGYMKAIKAKIQEAAAKNGKDAGAIFKAFETSAQAAAKKIPGNFKDYKVGESMNPDVLSCSSTTARMVSPPSSQFSRMVSSSSNSICLCTLSDLTRCVRVSKQWLQIFAPLLWYAFNDKQTTSWGQTVGGELEDLDWLEFALKSYGHHIRHLTINSARTVEILASHPHICQGLIRDTVPQMRRFKLPATLDGANKAGGLCLGLGRKCINDTTQG
ncbi:hypothetical protein BG000_000181 [Podila horticola]|nr:hypothetical protein BG000_000181 [Podila horticola]